MTQPTPTATPPTPPHTPDTSQPRKPDALLWIDVETTALDPREGQLLETGILATDMQGETIEPLRTWTIRHDDIRMNPTTAHAIDMHARNGLIRQTFEHGQPADRIARDIQTLIDALADRYTLHPAGTQPEFDLQWIRHHLGLNLEHLDYHKLDMTALRILTRQTGLDTHARATNDHRAATCITRDLVEYANLVATTTALAAGRGEPCGGCHEGDGGRPVCR